MANDTAHDPSVSGGSTRSQKAHAAQDPKLARDVQAGGAAISRAASGPMSAGVPDLQASFADIEALAASIASLSSTTLPMAADVGSVSVDGDLLASAILSPGTAATTSAAALAAASALGVSVASVDALALVVGSAVTSYQLVDTALASAAAAVGTVGSTVGATFYAGYTLARDEAPILGASLADGADAAVAVLEVPALINNIVTSTIGSLGAETGNAFTRAWVDAGEELDASGQPFTEDDFLARVGANLAHEWNADEFWGYEAGGLQASIGALGPAYDGVVGGLIVIGQQFGLFNDGRAELVTPTSPDALAQNFGRNADSAEKSWDAIYGKGDSGFETQGADVIPTDTASMFASLAQIDGVGKDEKADIRIFTITDANGNITGYRVQIPSTQSWDPSTGTHSAPNDLTSDMFAMTQGDSTSLAQSVYLAMEKAGIDKSTPVELDGFSLGGITAGAIAADNTPGYNIAAIHTAGSPIARMDIPDSVQVTSLEATQDPVATLDGGYNPDRPGWTTYRAPGATLANEPSDTVVSALNAHSADRYGAMAAGNPDLAQYGALDVPAGGSVTVNDYYAERTGVGTGAGAGKDQ